MSDEDLSGKPRASSILKQGRTIPYTAKDFQLEVLAQLGEMQGTTESLQQSLAAAVKGQEERGKLLRFDGRTLIAIGAIALSLTGYVLQDARNSSKRDADIETTKARVLRLEEIAATNTEGRVRTEVELGELREGQAEIKHMIEAHDSESKKLLPKK